MNRFVKILLVLGGILLFIFLLVFIIKNIEDAKLSEIPKDWIKKECKDFTFKIPPSFVDKSWNNSNITFASANEYFEVTIDYQEDLYNTPSIRSYISISPNLVGYVVEDDKFNYSEDCELLSHNFSTIGDIEAIKMIESFSSENKTEILMESYLVARNGYLVRIRFLYSKSDEKLKERIYRTFTFS